MLRVRESVSGGIFLSYRCTAECRHCMYACSPFWRDEWISVGDLERVLSQLAGRIVESPLGPSMVGLNYGLHFTGGEPFLNFNLLLKAVELARDFHIPSVFAETNAYWCIEDGSTRSRLNHLKDAGLHGLLVSVNPFIVEWVPFERVERAVRIGREVFGRNLIVYQDFFYHQLKGLGLRDTLSFERYLGMVSLDELHGRVELLPTGRAVYRLAGLYRKYPARFFFDECCREELSRGWHIHVDNYCNYITGYCGGISIGDGRDVDSILEGVDLRDLPIIRSLLSSLGCLYMFAQKNYGYKEHASGYISKCHLCLDIRKHLSNISDDFKELKPKEFYHRL